MILHVWIDDDQKTAVILDLAGLQDPIDNEGNRVCGQADFVFSILCKLLVLVSCDMLHFVMIYLHHCRYTCMQNSRTLLSAYTHACMFGLRMQNIQTYTVG